MTDFLLIANKNCITYKEFFPLIKDRKVNIGYTHPGDFDQPEEDAHKSMQGLTRWFTTLSTASKPPLVLTKTYDPEKYKHYDNYDAINVDRVKDIPWDYDGVIGCPITILDHNLDNVEIVWKGGDIEWAEQSGIFTPPPQDIQNEYKDNDETWRVQNPYITTNGKPYCPYNRIFIKKNFEIEGAYNYSKDYDGNTWNAKVDGEYKYKRVLIKKNFEIEGCFNNYTDPDPENGLIIGTPTKVSSTNSLFRGPAVNEEAKYFRILIRRKR